MQLFSMRIVAKIYRKRQNLSKRFIGFHPNAGKACGFCFICIESDAIP